MKTTGPLRLLLDELAGIGSVPEIDPADLEWDLADQLRKSLRASELSTNEMADFLGVARQTVSNWTNGRAEPRIGMLRLWSLRTGVPFEWFARPKGFEPPTSWLVAA